MNRAQNIVAALVAGLALTFAHPLVLPPFGPYPLLDTVPYEIFIVPGAAFFYFCALRPTQRKRWAMLAAFVHFTTLLFWLDIAMTEFAKMPRAQSMAVVALLAGYLSLYLAALPALASWLMRHIALPGPVCFAAAVVALEWLRTHVLSGFPWGLWGYSQARNLPLANLAAWGGIYLVTAVIAVSGAWALDVWRTRSARSGLLLLSFVLLAHCVGGARLWTGQQGSESLSVALLQGNINQSLKNQRALSAPGTVAVYKELLAEATDAELVIWPESGWPYATALDARFFSIASQGGMVVGTERRGVDEEGAPVAYNGSVYVEPGGQIVGTQDKLHLVPFGEYVPARWLLPVERFVPGLIDFSPGEESSPLGPERIGVQICFDGIFPALTRAHVRAGAEILANLTNDAWYGVSSAPFQHLAFYVFRAIEADRFVLRATNTGVSAIVGPRGRIRARSQLGERTVVHGVAERRQGMTLYAHIGNWVVACALAFCAAAALAALRDRIRRSVDTEGAGEALPPPDRGEGAANGTQ